MALGAMDLAHGEALPPNTTGVVDKEWSKWLSSGGPGLKVIVVQEAQGKCNNGVIQVNTKN